MRAVKAAVGLAVSPRVPVRFDDLQSSNIEEEREIPPGTGSDADQEQSLDITTTVVGQDVVTMLLEGVAAGTLAVGDVRLAPRR